jgi:hypothetical protein
MSEARVIIGLSAVVVATEDALYVVVTRDGGDAFACRSVRSIQR